MPLNEHDLLHDVLLCRDEVENLETQITTAKARRKEAEQRLIDYLDNRDQKGFKSEIHKAEVTKVDELRISIKEDKQEEAFIFIDEELGRGDAIKMVRSVHHKTLTSLIGELIKKGQAYPKDVFGDFWQKSLRITKMK